MEKVDYYSTNEEISWVASRVFMDEHYGRALTEEELEYREEMVEDYKDEIAMAKLMLEHNPDFIKLDFKDQINVAANLIIELRHKRNENKDNSRK